MATVLYLRNTLATALSTAHYYMSTQLGTSSADMVVASTTSTGGNQWSTASGGPAISFVTGPANASFTLTNTDIAIWALESNMNANNGGGYQVFRVSTSGSETAVGGGRFDDGAEFGTANGLMTWAGNVTDTAFSTGERILIKLYAVPVGTGVAGHTCTLSFNGSSTGTSQSFFNIAETTTFGVDAQNFTSGPHTATATGVGSRVLDISETRAVTAVGVGSRVIETQPAAFQATATGVTSHEESFVFSALATATAVGVATAATAVTFGVTGTATAIGIGSIVTAATFLISALATAIGVTSHSESFIPGGGGGPSSDTGSALQRTGAWIANLFRVGGPLG